MTPVQLACGHEFCWECLARAVLNDLNTCPLCRSEQAMNPVELNIRGILGAVDAHKYFPSNVDPSEIQKRKATEKIIQGCMKKQKCSEIWGTSTKGCAVDLVAWLGKYAEKQEAKVAGIPQQLSTKEFSNLISPFDCHSEGIHIEIDGSNPPQTMAVVLSRSSNDSDEDTEATKTAFNSPMLANDLQKVVQKKPEAKSCNTMPVCESSFEDWVNEVLAESPKMNPTPHSVEAILV